MNFGSQRPSGIPAPAIRPDRNGYVPEYTTWHVVLYDIAYPDDNGFVIDTMRYRERAAALVRGRAGTIERSGYTKTTVQENQAYMLTRPGECYLVSMTGCNCNAKVAEDAHEGHLPPLPRRKS